MSRTDRHRPYWVQAADPLERDKYVFDGRVVLRFRACQCRTHWCYSGFWRAQENRARRHVEQRLGRAAVKGFDWE